MNLRTGTEAWKVVTNERESVSPLFMKGLYGAKGDSWDDVLKFLKSRRILKVYKKGSIITAEKHSPPLMCFSSCFCAELWADEWNFLKGKVTIIKVVGYKKEKAISLMFHSRNWLDIFKYRLQLSSLLTSVSISGAIAFRKVRVVE